MYGCRSRETMAARTGEEALLLQHLGYIFVYSGGATPKAPPHSLGTGYLEDIGVEEAPHRPICSRGCSTKSQCSCFLVREQKPSTKG